MRIPHGLRAALAGQVSGGDPYFNSVSLLMYGDGANGSTTFTDSSSNNFTITPAGNAQISTAQSKFGGASMYFDGSGDYLSVANSNSFAFGTGDFTVEFWLYAIGSSNTHGLVASSATGSGYWASLIFSGTIYWQNSNGSSNLFTASYDKYNQWTHVAFVRNSGTTKLYLNGVQTASAGDSTNYAGTAGNIDIGRDQDNSALLTGYIDDLRITKGVARYTANFTPPTASFSTLTPGEPYFYNTSLLLHGDGTNGSTTFVDSSSNNFTITPYGNAQISTTQSKFGGASMYFDGNGDYATIPVDADFEFGTGDFTIEFWIRFNSIPSLTPVISLGTGSVGGSIYNAWSIIIASGAFLLYRYDGAEATHTFNANLSTSTWYHVAFARNGTSLRCFVDGTQVGTTQSTSLSYNKVNNDPLQIGFYRSGSGGSVYSYLPGYIDDLRITKGVARYTANFTPPTAAFPDA